MSDHHATATPGPCGILHITLGPDHDPPTSPAQKMQRAISRLVTDLDLIANAYGSSEPRDHEPMAERTVLNTEQAQALHHALIDYQQKVRDRGPDLNLTTLTLPRKHSRPALPACPTCGETPGAVAVKDCQMTLDTHVDFTPCGHGFRISDNIMNRLAQLS